MEPTLTDCFTYPHPFKIQSHQLLCNCIAGKTQLLSFYFLTFNFILTFFVCLTATSACTLSESSYQVQFIFSLMPSRSRNHLRWCTSHHLYTHTHTKHKHKENTPLNTNLFSLHTWHLYTHAYTSYKFRFSLFRICRANKAIYLLF